jgi:hypothetical protein
MMRTTALVKKCSILYIFSLGRPNARPTHELSHIHPWSDRPSGATGHTAGPLSPSLITQNPNLHMRSAAATARTSIALRHRTQSGLHR